MRDDMASCFEIGEEFTRTVTFHKDLVAQFATMAGDLNPLHHDEAIARKSRFKGLIASGTHTVAIMMGALATYISERAPAVGLSYSVKLKKAIPAGEKTTIAWKVVSIEHNATLKGDIVTFEGTLSNQRGEVAVIATCANLIFSTAGDRPQET